MAWASWQPWTACNSSCDDTTRVRKDALEERDDSISPKDSVSETNATTCKNIKSGSTEMQSQYSKYSSWRFWSQWSNMTPTETDRLEKPVHNLNWCLNVALSRGQLLLFLIILGIMIYGPVHGTIFKSIAAIQMTATVANFINNLLQDYKQAALAHRPGSMWAKSHPPEDPVRSLYTQGIKGGTKHRENLESILGLLLKLLSPKLSYPLRVSSIPYLQLCIDELLVI